jgi:hypothetical protein
MPELNYAILKITDGTTSINLIKLAGEHGFHLNSMRPAIAEPKGGGVWSDSPLADGRRMVMRRWATVIEALTLDVNGLTQEAVIEDTRALRALLEQGRGYWTDPALYGPVWIEARSSRETYSRYAIIHDYRAPSDGDPYAPEFGGPLPMMSDWPLSLERGHWLSEIPDVGACLPLSANGAAYTYGANLVLNGSFETAGGGGADVFANWTETASDGSIVSEAGGPHGTKRALLTAGPNRNTNIQQNIAVTAGANYRLFFYASRTLSPSFVDAPRFRVANITSGGDIIPINSLSPTPIPDVATVPFRTLSQRISVPPGCNTIGLVLQCPNTNGQEARFDYVVLRRETAVTLGRTEICERESYFGQAQQGQISDIYHYDDSAGTFSANLLGAAKPVNLLPAAPAVNDCIYFGVDDAAVISGTFRSLVFDLVQAGTGYLAMVLEYSPATWTQIAAYEDETRLSSAPTTEGQLGGAGVCGMAWEAPSDWGKITINGAYGYWVRLRVTAVTGGVPVPRQQNREIYAASWPSVNVRGGLVGGDIRALLRHRFSMMSVGGLNRRFILWSRTLSRGTRFTPYINLSDIQDNSEISMFASFVASQAWVTDGAAPTGRAVQWTVPVINPTATFYIKMTAPLANHYKGVFRAFLRVKQTAGAVSTVSARLLTVSTSQVAGPKAYINLVHATQFSLLDLGKVQIPSLEIGSAITIDEIQFHIRLDGAAGSSGSVVRLYDLILIPIDESVVEITPAGTVSEISNTKHALVDAIYPRRMHRTFGVLDTTGGVIADGGFSAVTVAPLSLAPNKDQLIGIQILETWPSPSQVIKLETEAVFRYLSMRGDS